MPQKAKKSTTKRPKSVVRTKEEILVLLEKISATRAAGKTMLQALEKIGVKQSTYFKWKKRFSSPAPKPRGKGEAAARAVLQQVANLRTKGETLAGALRQLGVNVNTYRYWLNKYTGGGAAKAIRGGKRASGGKREPVLNVLEKMTANRKKRQELANQVRDLDVQFEALRKQLDR